MGRGEWKDVGDGAQVRDVDESELPDEIRERIRRGLDDGVSYSVKLRRDAGPDERMRVSAIHWRPGKPNALAGSIIKQVTDGPMPLHLDGHWYTITPSEAPGDEALQ